MKDRFTSKEIEVFELLRENGIFKGGITGHTTIVRTGFPGFTNSKKCEDDRKSLLKESEKLKEIIDSCHDIVYVDNPSMDVEWEEEKNVSKKKRELSRSELLKHLQENCPENYKPLNNWDEIHSKFTSYAEKKEQLGSQLEGEETDSVSRLEELFDKIKIDRDEVIKSVGGGVIEGTEVDLKHVMEQITQIQQASLPSNPNK